MIKWAEKQDENNFPNSLKMKCEIKMDWFSSSCDFCKNYSCRENREMLEVTCPLALKHGGCNGKNKKNLWGAVFLSATWGEWVKNAKKFYKQLKAL